MTRPHRIYLDDNATTASAPEVIEAMVEVMRRVHGNASSIHSEGIEARLELERARRRIEKALNAPRDSLIFTSGGTEANSLGIRGAVTSSAESLHIVSSPVEHKVVVETLAYLCRTHKAEVSFVAPDQWGSVRSEGLAEVLRPDSRLVVLMLANNELGSLSPVVELTRIIRARAPIAHVHIDAVQAAGRIPLNISALGADSVAIAAHKFRGPKGVGGLFVALGAKLSALQFGGGQERGMRAGTENIAGAVGMAKAVELAVTNLAERATAIGVLREALWRALLQAEPRLVRNSPEQDCLPGTLNVSLSGVEGRTLVRLLDEAGYATSSGSACTNAGDADSHVLRTLYPHDPLRVRGAVRISFAWQRELTDLLRFASDFGTTTTGLLPR